MSGIKWFCQEEAEWSAINNQPLRDKAENSDYEDQCDCYWNMENRLYYIFSPGSAKKKFKKSTRNVLE